MKTFREVCFGRLPDRDPDGRCLIVAEVAQTHDGSLGLAHAFIDAVAASGADAIKFQTHIAAEESTRDEPWRVKFSQQDDSRYEYWERMEFTEPQWAGLKKHSDEAGLLFLSTPFSLKAADLLARIGMRVWKIASGEVTNAPLLDRIISTGDPIILSSGMSTAAELEDAVGRIRKNGNPFAVLQCTSAYPCPPEKIGLNMLEDLKNEFTCPVGLSDHSGNINTGLAAATLGAEVLEVHVTLSREMFGPDVPASVTSGELAKMVEGVRWIERIIGNPVDKEALASELEPLRRLFTKSIYAGSDLSNGTTLASEHLIMKKPGVGLDASHLEKVIGKRLTRDVRKDQLLTLEDIGD